MFYIEKLNGINTHKNLILIIMNELVKILQRKDVKTEIKKIFIPILEIILCVINPYIYVMLLLVFIIFIMILAILIILILFLRNKQILSQLKI